MDKLFPVIFFVDKKGSNPVLEYMFSDKNQKDLVNIINVIQRLCRIGLDLIDTDMAKNLGQDLFELRKKPHRIMFAQYKPNSFILLHAFRKQTNHTQQEHFAISRNNLSEYFSYGKFYKFDIPYE